MTWKKFSQSIAGIAKSFSYSTGKFQPVYFWATLFNALIATTWIMKLCQHKIAISDTLLLGLLTFVVVWLGVYNWYKVKSNAAAPSSAQPDPIPISGPAATVIKNAADITTTVANKIKGVRK